MTRDEVVNRLRGLIGDYEGCTVGPGFLLDVLADLTELANSIWAEVRVSDEQLG